MPNTSSGPYEGRGHEFTRIGERTKYIGPIFEVQYPNNCNADIDDELKGWRNGAGYFAKKSHSKKAKKFAIEILGDIPKIIEEALKSKGITIELKKERGQVTPINIESYLN